jgi:uncharacterized integral membrane protein (TIGR00698 family)
LTDKLQFGVGIVICTLLAAFAFSLQKALGVPATVVVVIAGIFLAYLRPSLSDYKPSFSFCSQTLLRLAVVLLGFRIALNELMSLSTWPMLITLLSTLSVIVLGYIIGKFLDLRFSIILMSTIGVAICGASAVLAVAAILPQSLKKEEDSVWTVLIITLYSTTCMLLFPLIAQMIGLNTEQTGVFLGASLHDVAQVVGASYAINADVGDYAVLIKMIRVALLAPIVILLPWFIKLTHSEANTQSNESPTLVPWFLIGFAVCIAINSFFKLPESWIHVTSLSTNGLILTALAGLGLKIEVAQIKQLRWSSLSFIGYCTFIIAGTSLSLITLLM